MLLFYFCPVILIDFFAEEGFDEMRGFAIQRLPSANLPSRYDFIYIVRFPEARSRESFLKSHQLIRG